MATSDIVDALLRRFRPAGEPAVSADEGTQRHPMRPAAPYPLGRWKCVRATHHLAEYFTPGEIYIARGRPGSNAVVLDHGKGGGWIPHFHHTADSFWAARNEMDFEYLGA